MAASNGVGLPSQHFKPESTSILSMTSRQPSRFTAFHLFHSYGAPRRGPLHSLRYNTAHDTTVPSRADHGGIQQLRRKHLVSCDNAVYYHHQAGGYVHCRARSSGPDGGYTMSVTG